MPRTLLTQARAHDSHALILTDTNLCGALEFARLTGSLDVQPITGGELTLQDGSRLTLFARTRQGYTNLSRLFTLAGRRGPPVAEPRPLAPAGARRGSGAAVRRERRASFPPGVGRPPPGGRPPVTQLSSVVRQRLGLRELHRNFLHGDSVRNRELVRLAQKYGVPLIATNDVHYHAPPRYRLQNPWSPCGAI